ncbi:hypothetical protein HMPREF9012_0327 [Bacteroidetes bacterium oral taxon 272 str. F0290]|nr:hypothetical protein HMPREF9012_0327 [Bacteroidetes bacterium oral taxon 272 str. F0290]
MYKRRNNRVLLFNKINKDIPTREEQTKTFGELLDIMDDLYEKCPWDQTDH